MGPYKCRECGAWWSGLEHRCPKPVLERETNDPPVVYPYLDPAGCQNPHCPWCKHPVVPLEVVC